MRIEQHTTGEAFARVFLVHSIYLFTHSIFSKDLLLTQHRPGNDLGIVTEAHCTLSLNSGSQLIVPSSSFSFTCLTLLIAYQILLFLHHRHRSFLLGGGSAAPTLCFLFSVLPCKDRSLCTLTLVYRKVVFLLCYPPHFAGTKFFSFFYPRHPEGYLHGVSVQ